MKLTEEQLKQIEDCGKYLFNHDETAAIVEIDKAAFAVRVSDVNDDVYKRYNRGLLMAQFEVRRAILNLASQGSSQAQEMFLDLLKKLKMHLA